MSSRCELLEFHGNLKIFSIKHRERANVREKKGREIARLLLDNEVLRGKKRGV